MRGYDKNNRLTVQNNTPASNVNGATALTFGYDGMNRMTSATTDEDGRYTSALTWTFNTLSKPQTEKQVLDGYNSGNGRTVTYAWDERGQKTAVTYPTSGAVIGYMRDALDRADKISRDSTEIVDYTFSGRRVLKKAFPGSHGLYTYDGGGRLTGVHHKDTSSGHTLAQFSYGWDGSNQVSYLDKVFYDDVQNTRITAAGSDKGDQYEYDGAKRLVSVLRGVPSDKMTVAMATNIGNNDFTNKVEYLYDPTGNRTTRKIDGSDDKVYAYDKANEMTTEGGVSLTYNKNGNFTGTSNTYKYTADNKLGAYSTSIKYHYDALGRFIQREYASSSKRFYYDGLEIIEENHWASSAESARKLMVYGERIDELLEYVDIDANPDKYYYSHPDMLGSVMVLADETGAIKESYRYKEFGETTIVDNTFAKLTVVDSPVGNDTQYTGRRQDLGAVSTYGDNWYDYRARVMRADGGRFTQRDPIAYGDSSNQYVYVVNRPSVLRDPKGTEGDGYDPTDPAQLAECCGMCLSQPTDEMKQKADEARKWEYSETMNDCLNGPPGVTTPIEQCIAAKIACLDLPECVLNPEPGVPLCNCLANAEQCVQEQRYYCEIGAAKAAEKAYYNSILAQCTGICEGDCTWAMALQWHPRPKSPIPLQKH